MPSITIPRADLTSEEVTEVLGVARKIRRVLANSPAFGSALR